MSASYCVRSLRNVRYAAHRKLDFLCQRSLSTGPTWMMTKDNSTNKQTARDNSSYAKKYYKKDEKEDFVSESAKKKIDPPSHKESTSKKQTAEKGEKESAAKYGSHHNPSRTGREQESKHMDEALAGKSGNLVGADGRRK